MAPKTYIRSGEQLDKFDLLDLINNYGEDAIIEHKPGQTVPIERLKEFLQSIGRLETVSNRKNNPFMDMIDKGIKDTKQEGIMTAGSTRIMDLDSLVDPDMDVGDLRTIYDDMMRESGGNYPGVDFDTFLKSIGARTASNDEAVRQLENLFEMFKEQGLSDSEAEKKAREMMENAPVKKAAEGGIVSLEKGGDPLYEMFEEVWKNTPASERASGSVKKATVRVTGDPLSYRNFLKDLGFVKTAEAADVKALGKYGVKIGDEIGSISAAAKALNIKPFELRTDENFAKLIKLAEDKGVKGFTTVGGAGKASISAVEDAATGIPFKAPDPSGEKIKFNQVLKTEQKDLNKIFGSNPSKAKSFEFVKRLSSAYPTLAKGAGLTALLSAAAKNAFGGPLLDLAIPTEMGIGTMMSPEEEALLISKEKIKETFK